MSSIIDQQIASTARRRVGLKIHFFAYALLIPLNWMVWFFTDRTYFWPVWPMLGWGFGLLFHWIGVYHSDKFFSVDKEVEKLIQVRE